MTLASAVTISAGGRSLSAAEAAVGGLRLDLALGHAHDAAELVLWRGSLLDSLSPGDELALAIGEDGSETEVWSGRVSDVENAAEGWVVSGLAPTEILSHSYRSQTYLQQGVADIVRDLAGEVETDAIDSSLRLQAYCVDTRRSIWEHLQDLAELAGCSLGCSASGGLRFLPATAAGTSHSLRYGADLLDWAVASRPQRTAPAFAAHGSASEQGGNRWHWLRNDPAPDAGAEAGRVLGAFHSRDAAEALAETWTETLGRQSTAGSLRLWGRPEVRPGDHLEILELPGGDLTLRVVDVVHRIAGRGGFVTECRVEGGGSAGGGLLGALGL